MCWYTPHFRRAFGELPLTQDRLRGKTENWQCEQKEKRTHLCLGSLKLERFQILNSSPSNKIGAHSLTLSARDNGDRVGTFVWDCNQIHSRLWILYGKCGGFQAINLPLHKLHSNLCALICLYLIQHLASKPFNVYRLQNNATSMHTTETDIVRFFNEHVNNCQFK